jgi:hypothetical protein
MVTTDRDRRQTKKGHTLAMNFLRLRQGFEFLFITSSFMAIVFEGRYGGITLYGDRKRAMERPMASQ